MMNRPDLSKEIEEIIVDCYDASEQMAACGATFEDGIAVPFSATLLGVPVEVTGFRTSDRDILQCHVVRQKQERWVAVEDLDGDRLPEEMAHLLLLYHAWSTGEY